MSKKKKAGKQFAHRADQGLTLSEVFEERKERLIRVQDFEAAARVREVWRALGDFGTGHKIGFREKVVLEQFLDLIAPYTEE